MASSPIIYVLAGVNGAGKSSIGGQMLRDADLEWFNPDTYTRELVASLQINDKEANALAWTEGLTRLRTAIDTKTNFSFETTLGGNTIARELRRATATHDVIIWYCGLTSPDLHIERVRQRVSQGGHDIPEAKIRQRWIDSHLNLIALIPFVAALQVFDNSQTVAVGQPIPSPTLILHTENGQVLAPDANDPNALATIPDWTKPIVAASIAHTRKS